MSIFRAILCVLLPPLAVIDQGPKAIALTAVLTFFGWVPGVVCALVYSSRATATA
ncbi:MAG: YqaE/Pmp3 family membrane protein [Fimbriimonadaceae bacterium]|nr:YqaE/Pmp3 family membrane protein [Fimbriimonadaceae bacterium]